MKKCLEDIWSFDGGFIEMDRPLPDEENKQPAINALNQAQYQQLLIQQNSCLLQHLSHGQFGPFKSI